MQKIDMFVCEDCGYWSGMKLGKCPSCSAFGSFKKVSEDKKSSKEILNSTRKKSEKIFFDIEKSEYSRIFPKGFKNGWVYLIGWEPWVWKSTLVWQMVFDIKRSNPELKIAYFSWEEQDSQVLERFWRLWIDQIDMFFSPFLESTLEQAQDYDVIVIDSIQTISSQKVDTSAWSIWQVKAVSESLTRFCKTNSITSFIIGHVTKLGDIAWPKYLEHIVDVVAYIEGDRHSDYRFLRTRKNRFGSSDETCIFEMQESGLVWVSNPNQILESHWILSIWIDNWRPLLANVEVLINKNYWTFPKRVVSGRDQKRLDIIIAVLEKFLKLRLWEYDIFINLPWEYKFLDYWLDLAVAAGIYFEAKWLEIPKAFWLWEIGLNGQIMKTRQHEKRKKEFWDQKIIDYENLKNISQIK